MLQKLDKVFLFFEEYGLKCIIILLLASLITVLTWFNESIKIHTFLSSFLSKKESSFISISAIFIGVYFALLTIFTSVKRGSIISTLSENDLSKLIKYLINALIGGFLYIFLTLFFSADNKSLLASYFNILLFTSLIYMFLSALRFSGYIAFIVYDDISKMQSNRQTIEEDANRQEEILNKLETFLNEYEKINREERTKALKQLLQNQHNPPNA
ncbi:hypothetical protein CN556_04135 [Bacillus wiedmannii]|uniref:hypothetical protein n=1 Tax=Bacillus wiedmannii TaxID=1890302 RepID=UPI000BF143C7|nr:hypothetical protein [Bacillus wiedmannii]PEN99204.1 hypothetical protein CN556_04135 [Bacillus wiedmannii]PFZ04978.1 hypothetical protein COL75_07180 [Bacillus wiedmannii]